MTRTIPVLLLFIVLWFIMPGTHLIMDEGYRLLQASSLRSNYGFPVLLDYPGAELLGDSAERLRPLPAHYGSCINNKIKCFYSPALALTALPFSGRARLLAPLLAGFLLWFVLRRELLKNGFNETIASLVPLAGTPLLYMSLGFWSYPAALLLAVLSAQQAEENKPWHAYLLAGAASLFRIEFALLFPFLFFKLPGKWTVRIHPAIPGLILLLAGNWVFTGGHILGDHLSASTTEQSFYGSTDKSLLQQKADAAATALMAMVPGKPQRIWLIPGALVWLLWAASASEKTYSDSAAFAGLAVCTIMALRHIKGEFGFLDSFTMKHPLMVFSALWLVRFRNLRECVPEILLLILLTALLVPMHTQGPFWGVRHLFLPLFLMLRKLQPSHRREITVIAAAVVITVTSLAFLYCNRYRLEDLRDRTETAGGAVITTYWMLSGWFTDSMDRGNPVVYASNPGDLYTAYKAFEHMSPVIVCLGSNAAETVSAAEMAGIHCSVKGEVVFGNSLSCVIMSTETN